MDSELGKGTTVRIYLPAIEVEIEKPKEAKAEVSTGSGTILMIEDEDVVIEVTQAMLEILGYRVMVAKTGKDAIHIAETFDGQIDLALLDIKLPDINGRNLYPLIMKARSNLKVIVWSGYSIDGPAREILDEGAQDFIQKPFSVSALSEKLKEVLEGNNPKNNPISSKVQKSTFPILTLTFDPPLKKSRLRLPVVTLSITFIPSQIVNNTSCFLDVFQITNGVHRDPGPLFRMVFVHAHIDLQSQQYTHVYKKVNVQKQWKI